MQGSFDSRCCQSARRSGSSSDAIRSDAGPLSRTMIRGAGPTALLIATMVSDAIIRPWGKSLTSSSYPFPPAGEALRPWPEDWRSNRTGPFWVSRGRRFSCCLNRRHRFFFMLLGASMMIRPARSSSSFCLMCAPDPLGLKYADRRAGQNVQIQTGRAIVEEDREHQHRHPEHHLLLRFLLRRGARWLWA